MDAVSGRLTTASVAREALQRYPWPLPTRVAGYIIIAAALVGLIAHESVYHPGAVIPTVVLTGAILLGYHLLSGAKPRLRPRQGFALLAAQTICALAILYMVDVQSTALILLYVVAGELQFLVSFRSAVAGTVVLWLIAVGAVEFVVARVAGAVTPAVVLTDSASLFCGFVFVAAVTRSAVTEVIQRHQATILFEELTATHARLQTYVDSVEALTVARERNRLARDIHDTLGHYLTVINVQIETAQKLSARDPARGQAALATAKRLASECLAEVRRSVEALRPAALDGVALPEAIARLVDDLRRSSGVTIHVESHGVGTLSPDVEVTAYRVIQEALTNVRKHARAKNVWLDIEWGPTRFGVGVRDDGCGAPIQQPVDSLPAEGFGLASMRERVAAVGGMLEIHSAPGAGFCVAVQLPYPSDATEAPRVAESGAAAEVKA